MTDIDITYGTARVQIDPLVDETRATLVASRTLPIVKRHIEWQPNDAVTALTLALGALGTVLTDEAIEHVKALVSLDASGHLIR